MPHMEGIFINGEKAKFHPEDILDTNASQYTEEIGTATKEWLSENLTPESAGVVDKTLSIEGAAADAKETGNRINELKSDLKQKADQTDMLKVFPTDTASGSVASFADGANVPVNSLIVNIDPVQEGTGDPSPDNVRPISGWTGAKVTRCGKNVINVNSETWDKYNVSQPFWGFNAVQIVEMLNALKPGTYTFTFHEYVDVVNNTGSGTYGVLFRRNVNGVQIDIDARIFRTAVTTPKELSKSVTFTLTEDDAGAFAHAYLYTGFPIDQAQNSAKFYDFQIELGSTATDYEPYSGQTYSITFPTEAGTVYGGTLDVVNGVLTVTHALLTLNSATMNNVSTYPGWKNSGIRALIGAGINTEKTMQINVGNVVGINTSGASTDIIYMPIASYGNLSQSDWIALALDVQFIVPLATPTTVQLTPHKVATLLGANNIFADCGDVTAEYRADPTLYIHSNPPIDTSLSIAGAAADAKEVGIRVTGTDNVLTSLGSTLVPEFSQGSLTTARGEEQNSSTTRIRTDFIKYEKGCKVHVESGCKYSVRVYDSLRVFVPGSATDWILGDRILALEEGQYFRLVAAYQTDAAIAPGDITPCSVLYLTDRSLTESGKIPDAKAVGDVINRLSTTPDMTWSLGSISYSNGSESSSTSMIRSDGYFRARNFIGNITERYVKALYALRYYDSAFNYVGSDELMRDGYVDGSQLVAQNDTIAYFRVVMRYDDHRTISGQTEINTLASKLTVIDRFIYTGEETESDDEPIAEVTNTNSFLGNVSIRAAKVINFSDGTPPVIDWYLLQSVDNKFYRSKDLVTKEYLFTFSAPNRSRAADWSCGITKDNDIIFIADAAGLAETTGTRLNDGNRINPVCFLASENYSIEHTIDFGSSLKPCGWLGNVGFCVLPSGNVVFAEYTRGTVATANVWLITGDITNPANWSVKWSSPIIDSVDSSTEGVKHCHEVQYDFYTGILYFGTGDSTTGSYCYYSTDNGSTWTQLYQSDKLRCRRLSYVFTPEKVYWASDSYEASYHSFFVAERDANGVVDIEHATAVQLDSSNYQACYGCVYLEKINAVVMMDRSDASGSTALNWYAYDIDSQSVKLIGTIKATGSGRVNCGFRTKFVDWYPNGNDILVGFNPSASSINPDTNQNALCGNLGGTTGDGSTRINNLVLSVYKNNGNFSFKASTLWI